MKKYTRKQAEQILSDRGEFWTNCIDLYRINSKAYINKDWELEQATRDLNGYVLGY